MESVAIGGDNSPSTVETFSKSETKVKEIWPARIEFWCNVCTQKYIASRKNHKGEFEEQLICQHMILKKVVK